MISGGRTPSWNIRFDRLPIIFVKAGGVTFSSNRSIYERSDNFHG